MRAVDMKTAASPGLVYIAVNPAEEDVCRIGIAVGEAERARVRQLANPWHIFAERSVSDASAASAELCRRLNRYRNTARSSRREFLIPPDEAESLLDLIAGGFPLEARNEDDDAVAPVRIETVMETPEESVQEPGPEGDIARRIQSSQAAFIHDPPRWIGYALALLFVLIWAVVGPLAAPLAWLLMIPFCGLLVYLWLHAMYPLTHRALRGWGVDTLSRVTAGPEGLAVDGRLRVPASTLRAGFVVPPAPSGRSWREGPTVLLERKHRWPLMLLMGSVRDARELLRALGLDASQKAFSCHALCGKLTIGIDGIACAGSDGQQLFFSFPSVKDVSRYHLAAGGGVRSGDGSTSGGIRFVGEWGVDLELHDGRSVRIPVTRDENDPLTVPVEERIRECLVLSRKSHVPADATEALRRRGRPVEAWLKALRAIGSGANADHRTAPVPTETLWEIVESASSTPDDRIAAAVSLGSAGAEVNRDRLRIAAETTSAPRVRVALAAAADHDEAALIESLSAIEGVAKTREKEK